MKMIINWNILSSIKKLTKYLILLLLVLFFFQLAEELEIDSREVEELCENKTVIKEVLSLLQKSGLKGIKIVIVTTK